MIGEGPNCYGSSTSYANLAPGNLGEFSVIGGSALTHTGSTYFIGHIGVTPGTVITGIPYANLQGGAAFYHVDDLLVQIAKAAITAVYNAATVATPTSTLAAAYSLGGVTLGPGIYSATNFLTNVAGIFTLDGGGDYTSLFLFVIPGFLETGTASTMVLINGAQAQNIFWRIGSYATLNSYSNFYGTVYSVAALTVDGGPPNAAIIYGRLLSMGAAVTISNCAGVYLPTPFVATPSATTSVSVSVSSTGSISPRPTKSAQIIDLFANLGLASDWALQASSYISNDNPSIYISGIVGVTPGTVITGITPSNVDGGAVNIYQAGPIAAAAKTDIYNAYTVAESGMVGYSITMIAGELGGLTLLPGIYESSISSFMITTTLTLDGNGNSSGIFLFRMASSLTTVTASSIILTNGANANNIFWKVASSATLSSTSTFFGTIYAYAAITVSSVNVNIVGRLFAQNSYISLGGVNSVTLPT